MSCPYCHGSQRRLPGPYPAFWCGLCGALVVGSEEERQILMPEVIAALSDAHGSCLRDDHSQCCVWDVAAATNLSQVRKIV